MEFDIAETYLNELPSLPYEYEAMEPYIDARTMEIHHKKHHQTYINNLHKALEKQSESQSLKDIVSLIDSNTNMAIRNNAGGHYNHSIFWNMLSPKKQDIPDELQKVIVKNFSSLDGLKKEFKEKALARFGSGWVWVCSEGLEKISVHSTSNQDNPMMKISSDFVGLKIILGLDLWEHAYYLKYQNRRADYVDAFWNVVNWDFVQKLLMN